MTPPITLRPFEPGDLQCVAALYTASVHGLGAAHYDPAQLVAWAPRPPDADEWAARLSALKTLIADRDGVSAGFIAHEPSGHIALLFTAPAFARRGVATALYEAVEHELIGSGVNVLTTFASLLARPFFASQGFTVVAAEDALRNGVRLRRYSMRKVLRSDHEKNFAPL